MSEVKPLSNLRFASDPVLVALVAGTAVLKRGSNGPSVLTVQQCLLDMGFNLKRYVMNGKPGGGPDGAFGPQTESALKNFQAHAQCFFPTVSPSGVLDAATLRALDALAPPPGLRAWEKGGNARVPGHLWKGDAGLPLRIVVVKQEHRTYLFAKDGQLEWIVANATGRLGDETDTGLKRVESKLDEAAAAAVGQNKWGDPTVFGPRILNLSWADGRSSGEELHGTSRPDQLGGNVSHGCVRHYNEDILELYKRVSVGEKVAIVERIDSGLLKLPTTSPVSAIS